MNIYHEYVRLILTSFTALLENSLKTPGLECIIIIAIDNSLNILNSITLFAMHLTAHFNIAMSEVNKL